MYSRCVRGVTKSENNNSWWRVDWINIRLLYEQKRRRLPNLGKGKRMWRANEELAERRIYI
jgi:hypothetical protein